MAGDTLYMPDRSDSVFGSFDWTDLIEEIAHRLRCEQPAKNEEGAMVWKTIQSKVSVKNKKGDGYTMVLKDVDPLMNEKGIGHIITMITGICHRITAFSNIREDDLERIYGVLQQHSDALIVTLGMNYSEYDIKSSDHIWLVWFVVMDYIEFAVLHAVNEGSKMFVAKAVSERQIQQIQSGDGSLLGG